MRWFTDKNNVSIRRSNSIEWRLVDAKAVLINMDEGMLLQLDEVGTSVWLAIDGARNLKDLAQYICSHYDVREKVARKDIVRLLRNLKANDAIEYV